MIIHFPIQMNILTLGRKLFSLLRNYIFRHLTKQSRFEFYVTLTFISEPLIMK